MAEQRGSGWWFQLKGEVDPFERWQVGGMEGETQSDKEMGAGAFREAQKKFPYLSQRIIYIYKCELLNNFI